MTSSRAAPWLNAFCIAIGLSGVAFALGIRSWRRGTVVEEWPVVEHLELDLDLSQPPRFQAGARLELSGIRGSAVALLLNRDLEVFGAKLAGGPAVEWKRGRKLRSRYHSEGRVLRFDLGSAPPDGRARLHLSYGGRGFDGSEERDWRGVLLCAADELRMSEQTIFYPQVPVSSDGPAVAASTARVTVLAPAAFEVYAPGEPCGEPVVEGGARRWCFELARPGTLAVLAGTLRRSETRAAGGRVVSLLTEAHHHHAPALAERALAALEQFAAWWGPVESGTLGIVEIIGRGSSYNWMQQGVVTFDRYALDDGVDDETLAHEIAHLWWGQHVGARGAGERFLTESLAEYASWRFVEAVRGADAARELARAARDAWLREVHGSSADAALAEVGFDTPGYQALAYSKGPLVLRALEAQLGKEALDGALADYAERGARVGGTLALLEECLRRAAGDRPVALPWLYGAGHAHLELAEQEYDAPSARARVRVTAARCPSGAPTLLPPSVTLDVRGRGRAERIAIALKELPGFVDFSLDVEPAWIALDPDAHALVADCAPLAPGCGRLVGSEPVDGARDVPLGRFSLLLRFDRALAPLGEDALARMQRASREATLEGDWIAPTLVAAEPEEGARALRLAIERTLPAREHVVALPPALVDIDGIPLRPVRVLFTTQSADGLEPPRIVATSPASGETGVALDLASIRVEFSADMRSSSGFKTHAIEAQARLGREFPPMDFAIWIDERTADFPIDGALEPATTYALVFRENYRDELGVQLEEFVLVFTTEGAR